jgi:enamine deaminase RidA (YjgF/YER057c/UK114 family)
VARSDRQRIRTGGPWEERFGYARAVRVGRFVYVAGTTAARPDGSVAAPGDLAAQASAAYATVRRALERAGGSLADVVRVRYYVTSIDRWPELAAVHRAQVGAVRPASTLVQVARLIRPELLVEIEIDAVLRSDPPRAHPAAAPARRHRAPRRRRPG